MLKSIIEIFSFSLSDKLKFSIKASLSMTLAYLIPLSQDWAQPSTAAITVMLIAAMGSVSESVLKGAMRVIGTVTGAIIGMTLISIFPQDRILYLISLSIMVSIPLYLVRAYKGDSTIFMLTAITMMMVFKNGEVNDVFIYGIDKTFMTIFGIVIYTVVGVFLWPVRIEDNTTPNAINLSQAQAEFFSNRDLSKEKQSELLAQLLEFESKLEKSTMDTGSASIDMQQWHSIIHNYKNINIYLTLLSMHDREEYTDNLNIYISNYKILESEISLLIKNISFAWEKQQEIYIPKKLIPKYQTDKIKDLSHLERASLISTIQDMKKLHEELIVLAKKLNQINSPLPTFFQSENIPQNSRFLWGNIEHLKGVLVTFIIFWVATLFWIELNPFGGFMIVALATGLSVLTTFTPVKPSLLIIVFTIAFIFAIFMYIFILPNLHYAWELGLFIFIYSFISFHLINPKMTIFFLLGLFTFNISNVMYYDFSIFLLILLIFYLFLTFLHIFYYIPFSTRAEHLFLNIKNRFFKLSKNMLDREQKKNYLWFNSLASKYAQTHLIDSVENMQLWANNIDEKYFDTIDKKNLLLFVKESKKFAYLVKLLHYRDLETKTNPLIQILKSSHTLPYFSDILDGYIKGKIINTFEKDKNKTIDTIEESLNRVLNNIDFELYSKKDVAQLYKNISLRKNIWLSLFTFQEMIEEINFDTLKQSRF